MTVRKLLKTIPAIETSDGEGVRIKRSIGQSESIRLDPFLMLDEFGSDQSRDYRGGFPSHPHRGFETVTYMLEGHMLHEDHLGNQGHLKNGGVQWMTAGRGIIHSEMPQQESGRMRGFQLWLNLPAIEKMKPADYRDIQPEQIPELDLRGVSIKLIAGGLELDGTVHEGAVKGGFTRPLYLDIHMPPDSKVTLPVPDILNAMMYLYEGQAELTGGSDTYPLAQSAASILGKGDSVCLHAESEGARLLLLAGLPINEPVVQYGPFVMNSREEIEQALRDYRNGQLTS